VFKRAGIADDSVTVSQTGFPSSMLERQLIFSYQRHLFHLERDLAILKSHLWGYSVSSHCTQHFPAFRAYAYDQNNQSTVFIIIVNTQLKLACFWRLVWLIGKQTVQRYSTEKKKAYEEMNREEYSARKLLAPSRSPFRLSISSSSASQRLVTALTETDLDKPPKKQTITISEIFLRSLY